MRAFGERCALPFRRVRQHEAPDSTEVTSAGTPVLQGGSSSADLADGLVLDVQKLTEKA